MRVILIIGGALFGLAFAYGPTGLYGLALGAFVGFVIAELAAGRARASELEREVADLRRRVAASARSADSPGVTAAAHGGTARGDQERSPETLTPSARQPSPSTTQTPPSSTPRAARPSTFESDTSSTPRAAPPQAASHDSGASTKPPESDEFILVRAIREYFTGGNTLVRVGVVILFIGVAFLLRYVAEHTHVPIELRLSGVAAGAVVLLILGWRLRKKRPGYALTIQGGAVGILYLTVFASLRLFHVLTPGPAFVVLVLLAAFSVALALLQSSMALALFSIGCGFLAPIVASSGQGNHVVLFSYYGVLNLGILVIAWFKAWRPLNVVGFLFTFVIGTFWGVLRYRPELFSSTEPFLIGFFVLYVAIAILFSLRQRPILRGYVDGTIVFGVPAVAFGLQSALVHEWPFATAYSAATVSAMYLTLAWLLHRGQRDTQRLLVEAFMALGVVFLTLTVPLALDGRWSAATWSLEGAALIWVGCRQNRRLPRVFGALLQVASGAIFMSDYNAPYSDVPVLNSACLGGVMIAVASVFSAYLLQRMRDDQQTRDDLEEYEVAAIPLLFLWALLWWLFSGIVEILRHVPYGYKLSGIMVFCSVTAVLCSELYRRLAIGVARVPPRVLLPVMLLFAFAHEHPLADGGWFAWPIAFATFYFLCHRQERTETVWASRPMHAISALLLILVLGWELSWQVDQAVKGSGSWPAIAWVLVPAVALYVMPKLAARRFWPVAAHEETYVAVVGAVLGAFLTIWSFGTNFTMPGDPYPLPYVPVLNPLDLAQALAILILARYGLLLHKVRYPVFANIGTPQQLVWLLAALVFVWLNAILLRTLHHWAGIPYELEPLFRSTLVQTALTIFWTVLALTTMLFATRRSARLVWIVGAVLMAIVIGKLFVIDLSRIGTVERIVSFVGVGLLMLIVGYFSPLPPARQERPA
jgi:uncharacterized membrane protein